MPLHGEVDESHGLEFLVLNHKPGAERQKFNIVGFEFRAASAVSSSIALIGHMAYNNQVRTSCASV